MNLELAGFERAHREALERLSQERSIDRIWSEDPSFWKSEEEHRRTIASALGWLTIADRMLESVPDLGEFVAEAIPGTERVVLLGMGGSSLAPLVFARSFGSRPGFPPLEILDSTHPSSVLETADSGDPARTLFIVSSKSGTTLEPNILFDYFFQRVEKTLGGRAGERFVVVTDPGSALEKEGLRRKVRRIFPGDPRIGGRYSALSNFGIVPAAFAGVGVGELLRRARAMSEQCRRDASENPGAILGAAMATLALQGRDKLTFSVGSPIARFGMWIEQLIAESTGKEGTGILPVEGETLGAPDVYGPDRFFVGMGSEDGNGARRSLQPLSQAGHPTAFCEVSDALDLGAEMFRWEFATAVAGARLKINPFDQPNVQEAKDRTNEILEGRSAAPSAAARGIDTKALRELLDSIRPGDYFAITAYLSPTLENEEALNRIRSKVRDTLRVATTVGFGPRFLHSTGQLHKGGRETGVFLQITEEPRVKVPIPGKPYGFGEVLAAQAAGDLAALKSRGRRALRVALSGDTGAQLKELEAAVGGALA